MVRLSGFVIALVDWSDVAKYGHDVHGNGLVVAPACFDLAVIHQHLNVGIKYQINSYSFT